ncbi:tail component protein [Achromobacter phage JWF]|uniref:tail component protein n=1 Tax=Achromobacter phage JWF TaxID=1589748 RepID=UPI000588E2F5|nr:tail component protein [Achromobacter phage JWF]AJD82919.1 tail component protein [Achromobacter phage JWF]
MKRIHLLGYLNKFHPEPIEVEASTPEEALMYLKYIPGLDTDTMEKIRVRVRGFESVDALRAPTDVVDLFVAPTMRGSGAKAGGFFQIIVGIVVVVVSAVFQQYYGVAAGLAMIAGGVIAVLAPTPKLGGGETGPDTQTLFLPSTQNTVKIGTRKPILYGRIKHFGHYLSFNVDAKRYDDSAMNISGYCNGTGAGQDYYCVIN